MYVPCSVLVDIFDRFHIFDAMFAFTLAHAVGTITLTYSDVPSNVKGDKFNYSFAPHSFTLIKGTIKK